MKKKVIIVILLICLLAIGIYSYYSFNSEEVEIKSDSYSNSSNTIMVEIKGEVNRPGIYSLYKGSRIEDLVASAGGFSQFANKDSINLVKVLSDSECIIIDRLEEGSMTSVLININNASLKELSTLSGIGKVKAQAIIDYRNSFGSFKRKEDILNVPGITYTIYENIFTSITI